MVSGETAIGGFPEVTADRAGKYLTFSLARKIYGIPLAKAKEILGMLPLFSAPNTDPQIKGVINFRGRAIPVIDLRSLLGLREAAPADRTCIVVVEVPTSKPRRQTGLLVDAVAEVATVSQADIEAPAAFPNLTDSATVVGLARMKGRSVTLLDIDRILADRTPNPD